MGLFKSFKTDLLSWQQKINKKQKVETDAVCTSYKVSSQFDITSGSGQFVPLPTNPKTYNNDINTKRRELPKIDLPNTSHYEEAKDQAKNASINSPIKETLPQNGHQIKEGELQSQKQIKKKKDKVKKVASSKKASNQEPQNTTKKLKTKPDDTLEKKESSNLIKEEIEASKEKTTIVKSSTKTGESKSKKKKSRAPKSKETKNKTIENLDRPELPLTVKQNEEKEMPIFSKVDASKISKPDNFETNSNNPEEDYKIHVVDVSKYYNDYYSDRSSNEDEVPIAKPRLTLYSSQAASIFFGEDLEADENPKKKVVFKNNETSAAADSDVSA